MLIKKVVYTHIIPLFIALTITFLIFNKQEVSKKKGLTINPPVVNSTNYADHFYNENLENQLAFSIALKNSIPVIIGSSELTSGHLDALPQNFFKNEKSFSLGHAGFQSLAILTSLAANRELLQTSKITIILSPGWFEKQYSSGTSLKSFFEFCPTNYLYQIYKDDKLDNATKSYIKQYIYNNYDKISSPNAVIRRMSRKHINDLTEAVNIPFNYIDEKEIAYMEQVDFSLTAQQTIVNTLFQTKNKPYLFPKKNNNWDSLIENSKNQFKSISNNNTIAVNNDYYNQWLKNKPKKKMIFVERTNNQEFKDLNALVDFLKINKCNVQFVIMPLNTKAHENLLVLQPTINDITNLLKTSNFKVLDMFTPNVKQYEDGILEDIMHPYNIGWYKIDKFIIDNFNDDK